MDDPVAIALEVVARTASYGAFQRELAATGAFRVGGEGGSAQRGITP
jgi:hypothetical protein